MTGGARRGSILPGATIGFIGGGQLGRMAALSARAMGYNVRVLDPEPDCPARPVSDVTITARFDDADAAARLARECDVVTVEIEKIPRQSLDAAARHAPLRPSADVIYTIQDRARQKRWLTAQGFPVGPYAVAATAAECEEAVASLRGPCIVKSTVGGYDGRGQARVAGPEQAALAWRTIGARECVVELALDLARELSVLVARRPGGETVVYPPSLNHHTNGILRWSVIPGPIDPAVAHAAIGFGLGIARAFDIAGLIAVELFETREGQVFVNELAPRTHNTFHSTEAGCATSQFEQHVRAICDLPLGETTVLRPAAIVNLLGDIWHGSPSPPFPDALAIPEVRVHLYGKRGARPGRKMGHLSATGPTPDEALATVLRAYEVLDRR